MRCFRCHGTGKYWSFINHKRLDCSTCKKTGEVYGAYPKNKYDHMDSDRLYNGGQQKPSINRLFDVRS